MLCLINRISHYNAVFQTEYVSSDEIYTAMEECFVVFFRFAVKNRSLSFTELERLPFEKIKEDLSAMEAKDSATQLSYMLKLT